MKSLFFIGAVVLFFFQLFWGPAGLDWSVVEAVRLPRALGAVFAGVSLSVAGLLLQTALRNPLADPYVLGVSGASALTALASYLAWRLAGAPYLGYVWGALVGAAAASVFLTYLSRRASLYVVLIAGVLTSFVTHSALQLALMLLPPEELGYVYLALQGSFSAYPPGPLGYLAFIPLAGAYVVTWGIARWVSAYVHGEEAAAGLGVDVRRVNAATVAVVSATSGLAVALVGPVGFIGLMAPHMARWLAGSSRLDKTLPATAAAGAFVALLADAAMRLLLPRDVPVGTLLSLIGVPVAAAVFWRHVRKV
ncbi:MAG: iron ABC transporter permease [Pyrobaculum sp.]